MGRIVVENYHKNRGVKLYRNVYFLVGNKSVCVEDLLTDTDENAIKKAKELLKEAIEL